MQKRHCKTPILHSLFGITPAHTGGGPTPSRLGISISILDLSMGWVEFAPFDFAGCCFSCSQTIIQNLHLRNSGVTSGKSGCIMQMPSQGLSIKFDREHFGLVSQTKWVLTWTSRWHPNDWKYASMVLPSSHPPLPPIFGIIPTPTTIKGCWIGHFGGKAQTWPSGFRLGSSGNHHRKIPFRNRSKWHDWTCPLLGFDVSTLQWRVHEATSIMNWCSRSCC